MCTGQEMLKFDVLFGVTPEEKKQLIELGSTNPELRPQIRSILDKDITGEDYFAAYADLRRRMQPSEIAKSLFPITQLPTPPLVFIQWDGEDGEEE